MHQAAIILAELLIEGSLIGDFQQKIPDFQNRRAVAVASNDLALHQIARDDDTGMAMQWLRQVAVQPDGPDMQRHKHAAASQLVGSGIAGRQYSLQHGVKQARMYRPFIDALAGLDPANRLGGAFADVANAAEIRAE